MQLKTFLLLLLTGLSVFSGCKYTSRDKVTINGSFTNLPSTQLYIYQLLPASKPIIDSITTDASGSFSISFRVKKTGYYSIKRNAENEITLVVAPGEVITLKGNGNAMRNTYSVEGSRDSKIYAEYINFTNANLAKVDSLSEIFAKIRNNPGFNLVKQQLDSSYLGIFNHQKELVISFVNTHLSSPASLLVISENFGPNPLISEKSQPELFLKLDSVLFHAYPENSLINTFHLRMLSFRAEQADIKAHDKILKPGLQVPEISLPNSSGKVIKFTSFKGKLTLVYFWSSWNALSRQTNMKLTPIYSRYHKKGFEIYAVSIDSDPDLWLKAYMLDKAYWIQVIDTKGLDSEYCKSFAVREIPKMTLVGKDEIIIALDPEFGELETLIKKNI